MVYPACASTSAWQNIVNAVFSRFRFPIPKTAMPTRPCCGCERYTPESHVENLLTARARGESGLFSLLPWQSRPSFTQPCSHSALPFVMEATNMSDDDRNVTRRNLCGCGGCDVERPKSRHPTVQFLCNVIARARFTFSFFKFPARWRDMFMRSAVIEYAFRCVVASKEGSLRGFKNARFSSPPSTPTAQFPDIIRAPAPRKRGFAYIQGVVNLSGNKFNYVKLDNPSENSSRSSLYKTCSDRAVGVRGYT